MCENPRLHAGNRVQALSAPRVVLQRFPRFRGLTEAGRHAANALLLRDPFRRKDGLAG
jgi:hypothetical protein